MNRPDGMKGSVYFFDGTDPEAEFSHAHAMLWRVEAGATVSFNVSETWVEVWDMGEVWVNPIGIDAAGWIPAASTLDTYVQDPGRSFPRAGAIELRALQDAASSLMKGKIVQSLAAKVAGGASPMSVDCSLGLMAEVQEFHRAVTAVSGSPAGVDPAMATSTTGARGQGQLEQARGASPRPRHDERFPHLTRSSSRRGAR